MYNAGVAAGNGMEQDRRLHREWLEGLEERDHAQQQEIVKFSSFGRFVRASASGHNVQMSNQRP